jgi:phage shock protein A
MKTQEELYQETIALLEKKLATLKEMKAEIEESITSTENMIRSLPDIYDQH